MGLFFTLPMCGFVVIHLTEWFQLFVCDLFEPFNLGRLVCLFVGLCVSPNILVGYYHDHRIKFKVHEM